MRPPKRPGEIRFRGSGNSQAGGKRCWQLICARCATQSKSLNLGLPPAIIIKKFKEQRWQVGLKASDDLCFECQKKPIASHLARAKKALSDAIAPMVDNGQDIRIHFTELKAIAQTLNAQQARELIDVLKDRIPKRPPTVPKPKREEAIGDHDYESWLGSLEGRSG